MKLAIIGSRGFTDYELMKKSLSDLNGVELVISGGSQNINSLAKRWAAEKGIEYVEFVSSSATELIMIKACTHVVILGDNPQILTLAVKHKRRYRIITATITVK